MASPRLSNSPSPSPPPSSPSPTDDPMVRDTRQPKRRRSNEDKPDASGWSASLYNKTAPFVYSSAFITPVLSLLDAKPGEKILDLGCGTGQITLEIEKVVTQGKGGLVVGIDASESMVETSKLNGLKYAFVQDAHDLHMPEEVEHLVPGFDAVFSNATLHWCKRDPLGVLKNITRVLNPNGRLVLEMGGFMNCIGVRSALYAALRARGYDPQKYDPWYFPSMEDYVKLLVTAGFEPTHMSLTPRITPLPSGLYEWLRLFTRTSFLRDFDDDDASEIMREVVDACRVDCQDGAGNWAMTYMRLRCCAILKE